MTFLAPLGFLAAISIAILIIIYIIKPNFQQKYISSTFIWKLSLKYRKKRIPTSKLRDILIIICQIAVLACCTTILAQPSKVLKALVEQNEVVFVLDASASMRVRTNDKTRYDRALDMIDERGRDMLSSGGIVSVIRADDKPSIVLSRVSGDNASAFSDTVTTLRGGDDAASSAFTQLSGCGYGEADMEAAMKKCEEILNFNPSAVVYVYTDGDYNSVPEGVNVIDCRSARIDESSGEEIGEWNAAILDVSSDFVDGRYAFKVKVASYGAAASFGVKLSIGNPDDGSTVSGSDFVTKGRVECEDGETKTILFRYNFDGADAGSYGANDYTFFMSKGIVGYDTATVRLIDASDVEGEYEALDFNDDFYSDNTYTLPGGTRPTLRIQYASSMRTPFTTGILDTLANKYYKKKWNVEVVTRKPSDPDKDIALSGFDFYVFEGRTPAHIPVDGATFLIGLEELPQGFSGSYGGSEISSGKNAFTLLDAGSGQAVMRNIDAQNIAVTKAKSFVFSTNDGYTPLMTCSGQTVAAVKDKIGERVLALSFGFRFSNLGICPEYALIVANAIDYFVPATIEQDIYEIGEAVGLKCRGESVNVYYGSKPTETPDDNAFVSVTEFPTDLNVYKVGRYDVETIFDEESGKVASVQTIFVRMPSSESNINQVYDSLDDPYHGGEFEDFFKDLCVYVAAALVAFVFFEWLLHIKEGI